MKLRQYGGSGPVGKAITSADAAQRDNTPPAASKPAHTNSSGVGHYATPNVGKSMQTSDDARIRSSFDSTKHPTGHSRKK